MKKWKDIKEPMSSICDDDETKFLFDVATAKIDRLQDNNKKILYKLLAMIDYMQEIADMIRKEA